MSYLETLNPEQYRAVTTDSRYVRVNAGAGSGKTRVLAARIAFLIDQKNIFESSILAITFTNKVAKEMKTRILAMLGRKEAKVRIYTYHSFCVRFLREEIRYLDEQYTADFSIYDDLDQESVVKKILKNLNIQKEELSHKQVLSYISNKKNRLIGPIQASEQANNFNGEETKAKVYELYERELYRAKALDFDDLIIKTVMILAANLEVRERWHRRLKHILVDEFQDTNDIQYRLLKLIASPDSNVFVVGDPDQTIYTWRGANVKLIMDFHHDYECEDIILNRNYRSSEEILNIANIIIKNNKSRLPKDLISHNGKGSPITHYRAQNEEYEARYVLDKIGELRAENPALTYRDFVILYRSNYYTRNFEQMLIRYHLPYRIFGGLRFFQRKEIKDALSYLRLVTNSDDDQAFLRVINEPKRGLGEKTIADLNDFAVYENKSLYETIKAKSTIFRRRDSLDQFINAIEKAKAMLTNNEILYGDLMINLLQEVNYFEMYQNTDEEDRIDNIRELQAYLMDMQKNYPDRNLHALLQDIPVMSAQDEIEDGDYISLMTVHTAKGLEFPYVFIIGLSEGNFPNARSVNEDGHGIEEERRLCYVAITRAMKGLFLCECGGYDFISQGPRQTSRFIYETKILSSTNKEVRHKDFSNFSQVTPSEKIPTRNVTATATPNYRAGMLVKHVSFGKGVVIDVEPRALRIAFDNVAYGVKLINISFKGLELL